jgi:hypothetical protein
VKRSADLLHLRAELAGNDAIVVRLFSGVAWSNEPRRRTPKYMTANILWLSMPRSGSTQNRCRTLVVVEGRFRWPERLRPFGRSEMGPSAGRGRRDTRLGSVPRVDSPPKALRPGADGHNRPVTSDSHPSQLPKSPGPFEARRLSAPGKTSSRADVRRPGSEWQCIWPLDCHGLRGYAVAPRKIGSFCPSTGVQNSHGGVDRRVTVQARNFPPYATSASRTEDGV